jgi:hypothetical protein
MDGWMDGWRDGYRYRYRYKYFMAIHAYPSPSMAIVEHMGCLGARLVMTYWCESHMWGLTTGCLAP